MRRMNSKSVDLIYLDPPFNSNANYAAPIGSKAAGAEFKDMWNLTELDAEWLDIIREQYRGKRPKDDPPLFRAIMAANTDSDKSYLVYMAIRILEMHRILKDTGSIWLHCDPTMSHYLKVVMDAIFGRKNFRNEVTWCYTGPGSPKMRQFNRKHDVLLWYSKGKSWTFNKDAIRVPHKALNTNKKGAAIAAPLTPEERDAYLKKGKIPETWWTQFSPVGRIARERTGFPTQKPLSLLERIILASSNEGDVVFDMFCGCATTLVMAERLRRQWIGIDISPVAVELIKKRIMDEQGLWQEIIARTDILQRTDLGDIPEPRTWRDHLYGVQGGNCEGCDNHYQRKDLEIDHIVATSKGGTDHIDNLQLLCGSCNRIKGNRGMEYLRQVLKMTGE